MKGLYLCKFRVCFTDGFRFGTIIFNQFASEPIENEFRSFNMLNIVKLNTFIP